MQTPAWIFSADGLNHASPCVCKKKSEMSHKRVEKSDALWYYLSEDMVQQGIICVVIHGLVILPLAIRLRTRRGREISTEDTRLEVEGCVHGKIVI